MNYRYTDCKLRFVHGFPHLDALAAAPGCKHRCCSLPYWRSGIWLPLSDLRRSLNPLVTLDGRCLAGLVYSAHSELYRHFPSTSIFLTWLDAI